MGYECENCGMDFETTSQLANHKKKFCVSSKYGTTDGIDKRLEELKNMKHNVDYDYKISKPSIRKKTSVSPQSGPS